MEVLWAGIGDGWAGILGGQRLTAVREDLTAAVRSASGGVIPAVRAIDG